MTFTNTPEFVEQNPGHAWRRENAVVVAAAPAGDYARLAAAGLGADVEPDTIRRKMVAEHNSVMPTRIKNSDLPMVLKAIRFRSDVGSVLAHMLRHPR